MTKVLSRGAQQRTMERLRTLQGREIVLMLVDDRLVHCRVTRFISPQAGSAGIAGAVEVELVEGGGRFEDVDYEDRLLLLGGHTIIYAEQIWMVYWDPTDEALIAVEDEPERGETQVVLAEIDFPNLEPPTVGEAVCGVTAKPVSAGRASAQFWSGQDMNAARYAVAMNRDCPRCGEKKDRVCRNMSKGGKNAGRPTIAPHKHRVTQHEEQTLIRHIQAGGTLEQWLDQHIPE